jgi:hypothetical protein
MPSIKETALRTRAKRAGCRIVKSRRAWSLENKGRYMLLGPMGFPVLGFHYDASLEEIAEYLAD